MNSYKDFLKENYIYPGIIFHESCDTKDWWGMAAENEAFSRHRNKLHFQISNGRAHCFITRPKM